MLKKVILSAAAATLTFVCMTAFAVFDINVEINRDTAEAVVSGGGSEIAGQMLSLYCLREGVSLSEAEQEQNEVQSTDLFEIIDFTEADKDGNYTFSELAPKSGKGRYVFYVKAYGVSDAAKSNVVYIADGQTVNEFVSAVSDKTEDEVLAALIDEEKNGTAGAQLPLFSLISENGKAAVAKIVAGKAFSSLTQVEDAVNDAAAQVGILNPTDGAALDIFMFPQKNELEAKLTEVITKYNGMNNYSDNSAIKVLDGLSASARISVLGNAVKAGYDTTEGMLENVGICVINYELANASGYGDITGILKSHCTDVLSEFDYTSYVSSKYLNSINKSLLSKSFSSADELISYIKNYKPKDTESGGGSSSGSGGNGGGGGGSLAPADIRNALNGSTNLGFDDMAGFEWAKEAVLYLRDKGIVSGRDGRNFEPSESVTREEFVKMAVVAFAVHNTAAVCGFDDVQTGEWYESFVASAAKSGLVRGVSETEFGIGSRITRQDVAVIIARAKSGANIADEAANVDTGFSDNNEIAAYARAAVKWMKEKGYINGIGDGSFAPGSFCTRAEAAKIIYEAIR